MANDSLASLGLDTRLAHGSRTPQTTTAKPASGNSLPHAGTSAPAPGPAPVEVQKIDISRAIRSINTFLKENQRGLRFQVDEATGRTVITVINPVSGEVVRQIPPEELLNIVREMRAAGVLLDTRA
jgi:flagellar protein FlaG